MSSKISSESIELIQYRKKFDQYDKLFRSFQEKINLLESSKKPLQQLSYQNNKENCNSMNSNKGVEQIVEERVKIHQIQFYIIFIQIFEIKQNFERKIQQLDQKVQQMSQNYQQFTKIDKVVQSQEEKLTQFSNQIQQIQTQLSQVSYKSNQNINTSLQSSQNGALSLNLGFLNSSDKVNLLPDQSFTQNVTSEINNLYSLIKKCLTNQKQLQTCVEVTKVAQNSTQKKRLLSQETAIQSADKSPMPTFQDTNRFFVDENSGKKIKEQLKLDDLQNNPLASQENPLIQFGSSSGQMGSYLNNISPQFSTTASTKISDSFKDDNLQNLTKKSFQHNQNKVQNSSQKEQSIKSNNQSSHPPLSIIAQSLKGQNNNNMQQYQKFVCSNSNRDNNSKPIRKDRSQNSQQGVESLHEHFNSKRNSVEGNSSKQKNKSMLIDSGFNDDVKENLNNSQNIGNILKSQNVNSAKNNNKSNFIPENNIFINSTKNSKNQSNSQQTQQFSTRRGSVQIPQPKRIQNNFVEDDNSNNISILNLSQSNNNNSFSASNNFENSFSLYNNDLDSSLNKGNNNNQTSSSLNKSFQMIEQKKRKIDMEIERRLREESEKRERIIGKSQNSIGQLNTSMNSSKFNSTNNQKYRKSD